LLIASLLAGGVIAYFSTLPNLTPNNAIFCRFLTLSTAQKVDFSSVYCKSGLQFFSKPYRPQEKSTKFAKDDRYIF